VIPFSAFGCRDDCRQPADDSQDWKVAGNNGKTLLAGVAKWQTRRIQKTKQRLSEMQENPCFPYESAGFCVSENAQKRPESGFAVVATTGSLPVIILCPGIGSSPSASPRKRGSDLDHSIRIQDAQDAVMTTLWHVYRQHVRNLK